MSEPQSLEGFLRTVFVRSWEVFRTDPLLYILASLVLAVLGGLTLGLLAAPLAVGFIQIVRHRMRGESAEVGTIFTGFSSFLTALVTLVIIGVGVGIGMALLVIPGIVVAFVTVFALQEIAYKNPGVFEALSGSFQAVKKNVVGVLVVMVLLAVLNSIASATVIGVVLALPYTLIAGCVAYEELTGAQ